MSRKLELKYLFLISVIFIAACIETDIYLPAFPDMMTFFSASESSIQHLLTWNFIGICLSGPFYGPISDAIGRKKPLIAALLMFLLGSVMTLFADTLEVMLIGRVLQGLGSGGCFTLGTAILFDAFQKEKAISALNQLNMVIPLIMATAPMLGGYLNYSFGFRSNFLAIAIVVFLSCVVCFWFFEETLPKEKRAKLQMKSMARDFKRAFSNLAFWQLTIVMSIIFAAYITFLSVTAVLFVVEFGMSKGLYPFVQAAILGGWIVGGRTLNRAMRKWGVFTVKKWGVIFSMIGGVGVGLVALFMPRDPYLLTTLMTLYAFGANWVIGLYFPEGMEILPDIKGVTASLMTSARLLITALVVWLAGFFYNATIYPLATVVVGSIVILLPIIIQYERKRPATEGPSEGPPAIH